MTGDLITGGSLQLTWDAEYVGGNAGWSRAGKYDSLASWPNPPANQTSTEDPIYPVANLAFDLSIIPEPSSLSLFGLGFLGLFSVLRKRKH